MPRRAGLSAALVELTKALRHVALRGVVLKLAPARDAVAKLVMLRAALRDGRLLVQVRCVALKDAPAKLALGRAVRAVRAVALRALALKLALRAPGPLARPGAGRLVASAKIHVSRPKAPPVNAASIRLVRVPRARNRRHPSGVVHPLIAPRGRRASQWTWHLKPP